MEVEFSNVNWEGMEPMERFEFYYNQISPIISNFWEEKGREMGRKEAFPLVMQFTADLFSCSIDDIGISKYQKQPSTSTGLFVPKTIYREFFEKHQRQWVGLQRKEQAEILAKDYISQIEKEIESKKLDGFTDQEIKIHMIKPRIEELENQIKELSLPGNKNLDTAYNNVVTKSRLLVLKYLKERLSRVSTDYPEDFITSFKHFKDYEDIMEELKESEYLNKNGDNFIWVSSIGINPATSITALYDELIRLKIINEFRTLEDAAAAIENHFKITYRKGYFKRHREKHKKEYNMAKEDFDFLNKYVK